MDDVSISSFSDEEDGYGSQSLPVLKRQAPSVPNGGVDEGAGGRIRVFTKLKKWSGFARPQQPPATAAASLSVQSGDITLPDSQQQTQAREEDEAIGPLYSFLFPRVLLVTKLLVMPRRLALLPLLPFLAIVAVIVALVVLPFFKYPPEINQSIRSFASPDHPSSVHWEAFEAAVLYVKNSNSKRRKGLSGRGEDWPADQASFKDVAGEEDGEQKVGIFDLKDCPKSKSTQSIRHPNWVVELVYIVPKGSPVQNVFTPERIETIYGIEQGIYNMSLNQEFCQFSYSLQKCLPLNSLLTYFYVDKQDPNSGIEMATFNETLKDIVEKDQKLLFYTGGMLESHSSKILRSQVQVGLPLPCFSSVNVDYYEQHELVAQFFISLTDYLKAASTKELKVLYGGTEIFDYEVSQSIEHDAYLAIDSAWLVLVLMFVLTGFSFFSTVTGIATILSCFPLAYLFYNVVFGFKTMGFLNISSLFVIIGIGVDDVFVYLNTFKQSKELKGLGDSVERRLAHTIIVAGKATFFTSITTSAAFFANAVSQIPAIRQFGVFMGLVIIFCFLMVFLVLPLYLPFWHRWLMPLENWVFRLVTCAWCTTRRRSARTQSLSVRMSVVVQASEQQEEDGGVHTTSDDTSSSDGSSLDSETLDHERGGDGIVSEHAPLSSSSSSSFVKEDSRGRVDMVGQLMNLVQRFMLKFLARPILASWIYFTSSSAVLLWFTRRSLVWLFIVVSVLSIYGTSSLKFSQDPPEFLASDTNIQQLLNLNGNLTELDQYNCGDCSSWHQGGEGGGGDDPTKPPPTLPSTKPPPPTHPTQPPPPPPTLPPDTTTSTTPLPPTGTVPHPPPHSTTDGDDNTTSGPTNPGGTTPPGSQNPELTTNPTPSLTDNPTSPSPSNDNSSYSVTKYSNNAIVYVVFGVEGVERDYSPYHLLPSEEDDSISPVFDFGFSDVMKCDGSEGDDQSAKQRVGVVNALCRLCKNISNPDNGLVLKDGAECIPAISDSGSRSCLQSALSSASECQSLDLLKYTNAEGIQAIGEPENFTFIAMAFRSTTFSGGSAFIAYSDYRRWEDFIRAEVDAILGDETSSYDGAKQALSSTFQTSEYWVLVNTEIVAVQGSVYGISLSLVVCLIVVVLLSHNWRLVLAILFTILSTILTLMALFVAIGWRLGIVEAVTLSILVGNALDYCIHLTEGYMSATKQHMEFVERFKFAAGASVRVKRVLAAISFIGVSIISSALTTTLATLPLLATEIKLFSRFGEILILETVVCIVYTFIFCSTFLAAFGPQSPRTSRLNVFLTISTMLLVLLPVLGTVVYFTATSNEYLLF